VRGRGRGCNQVNKTEEICINVVMERSWTGIWENEGENEVRKWILVEDQMCLKQGKARHGDQLEKKKKRCFPGVAKN